MSLALSLGVVCAVFAAGLAAERYAGATAVRRSLSRTSRTLVGVVAPGWVYMAYAVGLVPSDPVAGVVVTDAAVAAVLSVGLWVGLPLVAAPVVGTDHPEPGEHC